MPATTERASEQSIKQAVNQSNNHDITYIPVDDSSLTTQTGYYTKPHMAQLITPAPRDASICATLPEEEEEEEEKASGAISQEVLTKVQCRQVHCTRWPPLSALRLVLLLLATDVAALKPLLEEEEESSGSGQRPKHTTSSSSSSLSSFSCCC